MISFFSKSERQFKKLKKRVEESGLFDKVFYLKNYHDARVADLTPLDHYCKIGIKEDRKPNEDFDSVWYREYYRDIKEDGVYPFAHFIMYGRKENRFQSKAEKDAYFKLIENDIDPFAYKDGYEDLKKLGKYFDPLLHYVRYGKKEGRNLNQKVYRDKPLEEFFKTIEPFFDEDGYLNANNDLIKAKECGVIATGFEHFKMYGYEEVKKGLRPIHINIPACSQNLLLKVYKNIASIYDNKTIQNPYDYFIEKKYRYIISGEAEFPILGSYSYFEPVLTQEIKKDMDAFSKKPLISIVMPVYNVDSKWLNLAIKSIEDQWYEKWELCIADDKSTKKETIDYLESLTNPKIKIKFLETNLNISGASNEALNLADGEYIALLDNDDEITPDALYEVVKAINETDAEFIYSDEDFMTIDNKCVNPHFKPDFSPDLLLSHNYITHFTTFKKNLLFQTGNFSSEFDGAQDYDLFLRLTEVTKKIYHIPKVLYHWRMIETSTSCNSDMKPEALMRGQKVLEHVLKRRKIEGSVENANLNHYFRVKYEIIQKSLVSIIVPFKDKPELLDMCISSILKKSVYDNFEIIGISNNSIEKSTFEMMKNFEAKDSRVKFYEYNIPFNYSDINNYAVNNYAKGEHIVLLNNDIEIISPEWIESMLEHSQREEVGCVGAKLYYPNDTIQHAGVIIGLGGYAAHSHKGYGMGDSGYFNRLNVIQNLSAVTAACLMVKKSIYNEVGGLNEVDFKVAYNDVDFCLRVQKKGYRNIFTPYAEVYHYESISRGYEETVDKIERFQREKDAFFNRHKEIIEKGDPYYNKNLTLDREDFSLRFI